MRGTEGSSTVTCGIVDADLMSWVEYISAFEATCRFVCLGSLSSIISV